MNGIETNGNYQSKEMTVSSKTPTGVKGLEVSQVAGMLGCSHAAIHNLIHSGELQAQKKYVGDFNSNPYVVTTPAERILEIVRNGNHAKLRNRLDGITSKKKPNSRKKKVSPAVREKMRKIALARYKKENREAKPSVLSDKLSGLTKWLSLSEETRELLLKIEEKFSDSDLQIILSL